MRPLDIAKGSIMPLFILFIAFTLSSLSYGQDSKLETALSELKSSQQKSLAEYKKTHPNWQKAPNDAYEKFYTDWAQAALKEEMKLRDKYCEKDKKLCLSKKEKLASEAQTRVAIGLIKMQNQLAKNPEMNESTRAQVISEAQRAANITLCSRHGKNCEDLNEKDKKAAELEKKRDSELEALELAFAKANPDIKKGDKKQRDFKVDLEKKRLGKTLALMEELCKLNPEDAVFCLSEKQKEEMKFDSEGNVCKEERVHQLFTLVKEGAESKEEKLLSEHDGKWAKSKECKTLLEEDKLAFTPQIETRDVASEEPLENEDEKSPRNYKAETCEWVSDLPRKIVYGPACGRSANRICTGYVVCEQKVGGGKFVRMSTCGPENCGGTKQDAINCTKQQNYFSRRPMDEAKHFASPKLKKILSGATQQ
jgi:hypothetical protein